MRNLARVSRFRCQTGLVSVVSASLVLALAGACAVAYHPPDLGELYDRAAQYHGPGRNPIVVVPGLTGSNLVDGESGRVVWGAFTGDYARPTRPADLRLIALPMKEGMGLAELRDDVRPAGVLDRVRVRILGIPLVVRAYVQILAVLGAGGYRDQSLGLAGAVDYGSDHYTCFQFDYDWRRDNVESARRLARFLDEKRTYVREEGRRRFGTDPGEVRFDVVAHSMGALVLRYFLRYGDRDLPADGSLPPVTWAGAEAVERVVLVGPPNAGSLDALLELVEGHRPGLFLPRYPAALLGTFPSIYQLLPRGRHGALVDEATGRRVDDLLDPELWERMGWGLASPEQAPILAELLPEVGDPAERRRIALDHLRKSLARARQLVAALDQPAPPPPAHLKLFLVAGDAAPTARTATAEASSGRLRVLSEGPGDGTVLRTSALLDERGTGGEDRAALRSPIPWSSALFLFTDHLGLTRDPAFSDNVLFWLLEQPRPRSSALP